MSGVLSLIDLHARAGFSNVPTLIFVDLQLEHIAIPRGLVVPHADEALRNCRSLLQVARNAGLPVGFVRRKGGASPFFNPATPFSRWIEGFEPTRGDMVFERDLPSCYSSREFGDVINDGGGQFVLAGFAGEMACLSTIIDAYHRGHRAIYVADASASHAVAGHAGPDVQTMITGISALYARVMSTREWIDGVHALAGAT